MFSRSLISLSILIWAIFLALNERALAQVGLLEPIRLGTQLLPPYQMIVDGNMTGLVVERIKCAMNQMNRPYELIMMDWSKAQLLTENNALQGFFSGSQNESRKRYSTASIPIIHDDLYWYMRKDSIVDPYKKVDKLNARYGAKFGTSTWLFLSKEGYNVVGKPQSADTLINMLVSGSIDVALEYELIFSHHMHRRNIDDEQFHKIPLESLDLSVLFANEFLLVNPRFLQRFNNHLSQCVEQIKWH